MNSINFTALGIDLSELHKAVDGIPHKGLNHIGHVFLENMFRSQSATTCTVALVFLGTTYESSGIRASLELLGKPKPSDEDFANSGLMKKLAIRQRELADKVIKDSTSDSMSRSETTSRIESNVEMLISSYSSPTIERQLPHLIRLMLVSAWTALEVLLGDAWELSLNSNPNLVTKMTREIESNGNGRNVEGKLVSIEDLAKHRFQISNKMGTILREKDRYVFSKLGTKKGIRQAYADCFWPKGKTRKGAEKIREAIDDKSLDALSIMRNAIVHRGAQIDKKFKQDAKSMEGLSDWKELPIGAPITIRGDQFNSLVPPVVNSCLQLIVGLDEMLRE